ncbi:HEAT repeat domain-containing protein [Nitrospirillum iridis]|uniref:HEAT repeat protein n=1 Tax=Nitrospirillum iridis TaxID=765888 RepID=A0A7X0B134_9PROT|nr:HEAT repeat domain-containing protein [Nitrospirillum iridis]MBB6252234.1 HEAT repeat protein [Nitrospirillum iridis]
MSPTPPETGHGAPSILDSLIEAAIQEMRRDDDRTPALVALQGAGTPQGLALMVELCRSPDPIRRRLGACVLGQMHSSDQHGDMRAFPEEACDALVRLLGDDDPGVMIDAIYALGHLRNRRCDPDLAAHRHHEDPHVRYAVAFALCGSTTPVAIDALLELIDDPYEQARDWAATALGQSVQLDGPNIRAALLRHTADDDVFTRAEAMRGLARRRDARVLPALIKAVASERMMPQLFFDAALTYLGLDEGSDIAEDELLARLENERAD